MATKRICMLLALLMALSMLALPVLAEEYNDFTVENGSYTVEIVPTFIVERDLPDNLKAALHSSRTGTCSASKPDFDNIWNLTSNGQYSFKVNTSKYNNTIYSNYVFSGHGGKIKGYIKDYTTKTHKDDAFKFKLYKTTGLITKIYSVTCKNGGHASISHDIGDSDTLVYFACVADETTMNIYKSYIEKG